MKSLKAVSILYTLAFLLPFLLLGLTAGKLTPVGENPRAEGDGNRCVNCHKKTSPALVMEWERSRHAAAGISCLECHSANEGDVDGWMHMGARVATLVTPKDCAQCHETQVEEFSRSHHAKAGLIINSLDNVLAEKVAGMPTNNADAVNGCWQCHGSIVKFKRDEKGEHRTREGETAIV